METKIPNQALNPQTNFSATADADGEIDLLEIFFVLLDHIWTIAIVTILGGLLALFYAMNFTTPDYEATAKLYAVGVAEDSILQMVDIQMGNSLKSDYQQLLTSRPLLEIVRDNLRLELGTDSLAKMINVTSPNDTRLLNITVRSKSPQHAMDIANELAVQAISYLPGIMECDPPNLVESAIYPTTAIGGSYTKYAAMGLAAGMVLSCGVYILLFMINDTFRSPDDSMKYLGIPALAGIPEEDMGGFNTPAAKKSGGKKKKAAKTPAASGKEAQ